MPRIGRRAREAWEAFTVASAPRTDTTLLRRWLAQRALTVVPAVLQREERWLVRWAVFLATRGRAVATATEDDAVEMAAQFDAWGWGRRCSSRRQFVTALRLMYRWALRRQIAGGNPWEEIRTPRERRRVPEVLTPAEVGALLAACGRPGWRDVRDRTVIAVLYATGCRASEVCTLDAGDVDLHAGTLRVCGKGDKQRVVLLDDQARELLRIWCVAVRPLFSAHASGPLFYGRHGQRLRRDRVYDLVVAAGRRAGLAKHVYPHLLRHTNATGLLEGGADIRQVQELLGHESIATTARYTHVARAHLRAVYDRAHEPAPGPRQIG